MLTPDEFKDWQEFEKTLSDLRQAEAQAKVRRHLQSLGFQKVEFIPSDDVLEMADRAVDLYLQKVLRRQVTNHGRSDNLTASDRRFMYECGIDSD
jgi:hypothetical protein